MKKFKIIDEFKEFAMRGNVIDMAVGVIIGGAFGKIITSLVNDIIMPLISIITGKIDISSLAVTMIFFDESNPIELKYGLFLQNVLDFLIVAVCIFVVIKMTNVFKKKQIAEAAISEPPAEPVPTKEEILLTEIRDILKGKAL